MEVKVKKKDLSLSNINNFLYEWEVDFEQKEKVQFEPISILNGRTVSIQIKGLDEHQSISLMGSLDGIDFEEITDDWGVVKYSNCLKKIENSFCKIQPILNRPIGSKNKINIKILVKEI